MPIYRLVVVTSMWSAQARPKRLEIQFSIAGHDESDKE